MSIAVQANYAGWCAGAIVVPYTAANIQGLVDMLLVQAIVVSCSLVLFIAFHREPPAVFDEDAAAQGQGSSGPYFYNSADSDSAKASAAAAAAAAAVSGKVDGDSAGLMASLSIMVSNPQVH